MTGQIIRETPRQATVNGRYKTTLLHHRTKLNYELFVTERSEPAVKSLTSGKTFFLTAGDLVDLAIAAGVDSDEQVPKKRKWTNPAPLPTKPLYESKPVPAQSTAYLAAHLLGGVQVYEIPEKLGNCVNYNYHLNRRVDQDFARYLKTKAIDVDMLNILVVDMIRDAKFLAEQLQCDYITGAQSSREPTEIWESFQDRKLSVVVVTTAMVPTVKPLVGTELHWASLKLIPTNVRAMVRTRQYSLILYHRHDTIFDRTSIKRNLALFQKPKDNQ